MARFALALLACLVLVAPNFADDTEKEKSQPAGAGQSLAEQLKGAPDDKSLFDKYMITSLGEVRSLLNSDLDAADERLAQMQQLIDALEPKTDAGKQLVRRAIGAIRSYGRQVELGRVTLEELVAKLEANPDDGKSWTMYQSKLLSALSPLTRTEPGKAEEQLNAARSFLAAVKERAEKSSSKRTIDGIVRSFSRLEQSIETGKKLAALVGSDAAPMEIETWVNGDPLTDTDLKGKVVLLDFWAVWCGPCIATFPHLREWHEKYADQGLVMIGMTRYQNYTWDDQAGRAKRAPRGEKVTPEQEQQMLVKFAEEHDLHHHFAIQEERGLSDYYAVTGIPHVVVIDREGTVRLIRVGSGASNARDISEMLAKLIAEG